MPKLKALPGRVILEFKPPQEKSAGGIFIPDTSKQRVEIGEVIDIGEPTNEREQIIASNLRIGAKLPVSYGAGTCYFKTDYAGADEWLKNLRVYAISEIAAEVVDA